VSDYLDVMREVERRIQQAEAKNALSPLPAYERPGVGVPERFDDHTKLMFDLQLLAFQGDITRVGTFMYGAEQRGRMYPEIGLNESHHSMSHHGDNPENLAKYTKLNTWHVSLLAYLVEKMQAIHSHMDLPIALIGGANGMKGNRHVAAPMGTPMSNMLTHLGNRAGIPLEGFGDSTGILDLDTVVTTIPASVPKGASSS
jgi:hypothetical protein